MPETIPDGPTDPRFSPVEENTTMVTSGYGPPPGSPAAPFSSPLTPPTIPGPPGPVGSPVPPVTEEPVAGRVYGETRPEPVRTPELAERGKTTVADAVVERIIEKIVNLTADEVAGVSGLYTGPEDERPVTVELEDSDATIGIAIQVEFGHIVHEVVEKVRASVISQSERLLGLKVAHVNVHVADVAFDPTEE